MNFSLFREHWTSSLLFCSLLLGQAHLQKTLQSTAITSTSAPQKIFWRALSQPDTVTLMVWTSKLYSRRLYRNHALQRLNSSIEWNPWCFCWADGTGVSRLALADSRIFHIHINMLTCCAFTWNNYIYKFLQFHTYLHPLALRPRFVHQLWVQEFDCSDDTCYLYMTTKLETCKVTKGYVGKKIQLVFLEMFC